MPAGADHPPSGAASGPAPSDTPPPPTLSAVVGALEHAVARRAAADPAWVSAGTAASAVRTLTGDAAAFDPVDAALAEVVDLFGLSAVDRGLLAVGVLAELHPSAHLVAGLLSGGTTAGRPTVALALELLGISVVSPGGRARLGPRGPLRRSGLLALDGDDVLLSRRLLVPDRVVSHLLGSGVPPALLSGVLQTPVAVDVDGVTDVADALRTGEPLVWVHAPLGTAGSALAVAACRQLDVTCVVGDLDRIPAARGAETDPWTVRETVRALALEAGLSGSVLVLAGAHLASGCLDELDTAVVPVVAVGHTAWDPRWSPVLPAAVVAGRLTQDERAEQWRAVVGEAATTRDVLTLRMTPEEIVAVGRRASQDAGRSGHEPRTEDVRRAARRLGSGAGSRLRTSGGPATLDDLVLPAPARREVERLIGWARDRDEVLALGELQGKGGKGSGICALFSGSPGTGKTLAAHVVADSLGMDLFQVDLSSVVDKYIGETEKNLERVFTQAESLNAVLFFDEADSLFGSRSAVTDAKDRYANQEVAYLLQRMEASEGITVLATNLRGNLDVAFSRRLHFMIHFPDPDEATRLLLWRHHLDQLPATDPDDPMDLEFLASTLELAGGDIRNVVLAATYDAVAERGLVGMRHVRAATVREMSKLGRRTSDARWSSGTR